MSQEQAGSEQGAGGHDPAHEPDTSERLYTTEELAAYGARLDAAPPPSDRPVTGDPLTDPMDGGPAGPGRPSGEPRTGPVPDPNAPGPAPSGQGGGPEQTRIAGAPQQPWPQQAPQQAPQQGWSPGPAPQQGWGQPAQQAPQQQAPQQAQQHQPGRRQAAAAGWQQPAGGPPASQGGPDAQGPQPGEEGEPRRFMTATDFLDRRADVVEYGPATWGWRGRVRRWSGGMISPQMGPAEMVHEDYRRVIQKDFDGPRTIAFLNPKGGAAKTTGVLAAGYTFGTVRGGAVVAWDNNETRGTLGIRAMRSTHRNTTRELLEDLEKFTDVYQSRIGDLGAFVRAQGDAHFDVLASDERPDVTGTIRAKDFTAVHQLLERFYRIILVDTGNNMRAENWLAAAEAADLLVVTSTVREDTGYSGLWMLDALQDAGYQDLKHRTITVLSDPSPSVDATLAHDLMQVYEQRTREVYRVPYDPSLVSGSEVPYAQLSRGTRDSWLRACAGMASAL
jgi:MinD-like ATPase involved in chromosome partitioning or flagellar assembly